MMKNIFVIIMIVASIAGLICGSAMSGQEKKVKQCMLHVEGMTCEKCSKTVEQTLEAIKGVEDVQVALDKKQVTVKFEENVDVKVLVDAVNAKGFKAALQGEQIVLSIEGMHCTHCAAEIKDILEKQQGVISADVSFEKKEAVVTCQPGKVSLEQLVKVIEDNTEYKASLKK